MTVRVLVTRPEPGNEQTARRLAEAGFEPVLLPLTVVQACGDSEPEIAADTQAVAITSPNALRFAPKSLVAKIHDLPVYAVGETSAQFARDCGLAVAAYGNRGATGLAALMAQELEMGARIAYPCGKVRRPEFESSMTGQGFRIDPIETYNTVAVSYLTNNIFGQLGTEKIDVVLIHSAKTGQIADSILASGKIPQISDETWFLCLSERIATSLKSVSRKRIVTAEEPNDGALIATAKRIFG